MLFCHVCSVEDVFQPNQGDKFITSVKKSKLWIIDKYYTTCVLVSGGHLEYY